MTGINDVINRIDEAIDRIPGILNDLLLDHFNIIMLIASSIIFGSAFVFIFRLAKEITPNSCDGEY